MFIYSLKFIQIFSTNETFLMNKKIENENFFFNFINFNKIYILF